MKRLFMFFCVACLSCFYCLAGSNLSLVKGDKKFLKSMEGDITLEFVWDEATYDYKTPLEEKFPDLESLKKVAWNGFVEEFNGRSANSKVVKGKNATKYNFTMKVENMDQYFKVMGFIPANATKLWGTLTVTDTENDKILAVIKVDEVDGGANPSPDGCFSDCFEELGKQLARFK